jgi:nucleotide-binding universal stress UspA family protein
LPELSSETLGQVAHKRHAPHVQQQETRARMLFASADFSHSVQALRRASLLAERAGAELYLLQVGPAVSETKRSRARAASHAAARSALRACKRSLVSPVALDHILVRSGDFADVLVGTAHTLSPALVVIAGVDAPSGKQVVRIARRARVPVLVSRRPSQNGVMLAAMDLTPAGESELRFAGELAERFAMRLSLLHNVRPVVHAMTAPAGHTLCTVIQPSKELLASRRAQLQALAREAGVNADTQVLSRPSVDDAILEQARAQAADLVVVGLRPQKFIERLFGTALASRVLDQCERSVLIAPIAA